MTLAIGRHTYQVQKDRSRLHDWVSPFHDEPFQSLFSEDREFHIEANRLKTFLLWPTWGKADPGKLALAGFWYTGEEDKVKCFECTVEISQWKESESPQSVHKRKSPYCALVRGGKTKNVPLNPDLVPSGEKSPKSSKSKRRNRAKKDGASNQDQPDSPAEDEPDSNHLNMTDSLPSKASAAAASPSVFTSRDAMSKSLPLEEQFDRSNMQIEENRRRTFEGKWPSDCPLKPENVAKAGFWYKGPHDRVECAFCRGRLVNWVAGDDPVGEHARHFPACPFIQELNNEPLRALKTRSARAMLRLGYTEASVLMAINTCKQDGKEAPSAEDIQEAIFDLEEEKAREVKAARDAAVAVAAVPDGCLSSGLRSGVSGADGEEELDSTLSAPEEVKQLRKKNEELKLSTTCKVCLGKEVNCVFLPCRHLVCCSDCASRVEYCPVCRLKIIGTVKTFMA